MTVTAILNTNAQRVTSDVVRWVEDELGRDNVFVTSSAGDARAAASAIVRKRTARVAIGGGDGTFLRAVTDFVREAGDRAPSLFALRLGSGNAIADVCRASRPTRRGIAHDLERLRSGERSRRIGLLEIDGELAHFAGVGLDAKVNEDFRDLIKNGIGRGRLGAVFHGLPGIVVALATRTVPRMFLEPKARLRVVNLGAPARRLDRPGDPIATGATIHEGPAIVAAVGTITQYARGLTFFPFANDLAGEFQLRVSNLGGGAILRHLPSIFDGTYRNLTFAWDFSATHVRFELLDPAPRHVGGDLWPAAPSFDVKLSPHTIDLVGA